MRKDKNETKKEEEEEEEEEYKILICIWWWGSLSFLINSSCFSLDEDECTLDKDDCHENATCTDAVGSFTCECNPGYSGDGKNCTSKWGFKKLTYITNLTKISKYE